MKYLVGSALVFAALLLGVWLFWPVHHGEVRIANKTNEAVLTVALEVSNQRFKMENIQPGMDTMITYRVASDSHYKVAVELASGKKLASEVGYVTNGLDFKDTLVIKDNGISLAREKP